MSKNDRRENVQLLPREPIHRLTKPLINFLHVEAASGFVLLICTLVALVAANSPVSAQYLSFWKTPIGFVIGDFHLEHSLKHWINDALMAVFFFVIGLEVKREIVLGELKDVRRAALPLAAAIGGMAIPAAIYFMLQMGQPGQRGFGIPMATDIAFVVGCMAVLGRRIPGSLRIMLLSLAIVDDIGAILVIAFFYTEALNWSWLALGVAGFCLVLVFQRLGVRSMGMYTLIGCVIWLGFHESGIHATIAGVVLGLFTPARAYLEQGAGGQLLQQTRELMLGESEEQQKDLAKKVRSHRRISRETISPLEYLIYTLHPWVAFVIMPVFALANAGVVFRAEDVFSPIAIAVALGLAIGKPLGIVSFSWAAVKFGIVQLPTGVNWRHLIGGGFLAGIGFTMALFISGLAFDDDTMLRSAKVGVLVGSLVSGIVGMTILWTLRSEPQEPDQ